MYTTDRTNMRLPIAVTPLNLLLIALMIIAPQLGKLARKVADEKKNQKSLDIVISRRAMPNSHLKKKKIDNKKRKKTISRLAMLEKADKEKDYRPTHTSKGNLRILDHPIPSKLNQGKAMLSNLNSERMASKPKARITNHNIDKKSFVNQLKIFARNRNYDEAEKIFMSRLENMQLAPLESLEKQSKFRDHFSRLVRQLDSKAAKN